MTVHKLAEVHEPDLELPPGLTQEDLEKALRRMGAALEPEPTVLERVVVKRALPDREILSAMTGLGVVLAVRVMLAAAMVGAFVLFHTAVTDPTWMRLAVAAAYALLICGPLVWLSTKRT